MLISVTMDDLLGLGLAPRTAYIYARFLGRAVALLAERGVGLADCKGPDVALMAEKIGNGHSQRQILRAAMVAGWDVIGRDDPPTRALRVPPRPKARCRALSEGGARQLEATAWGLQDEDPGLAVLIGLYSGLRRAEIAQLRWEHVVLDEHGRPEWLTVIGKGGLRADVPIHPVLAEVLERRRRAQGWVFPGRFRGQPVTPSTVWLWVRQTATQAGLGPISTHILRHTALAEANDRSGDLRAVQEIARHSRPETTAGYTRVTSQRLQAVMAMVDYGRGAA